MLGTKLKKMKEKLCLKLNIFSFQFLAYDSWA